MSAIVIDGGLVHYEAFGRGRPVVFVHGWLGSWRYWVPTMEALATDYRAYAFDLWGFGDSDKSRDRYSLEDYVGQLGSFMNELGIMNAPLVGHALGGFVAMQYAARNPKKVSHLAVVSMPIAPQGIVSKLTELSTVSGLSKKLWWRQIPHKEVQQEAEKTAQNAIPLSLESVAGIDPISILAGMDVLTLMVYGEKDNLLDLSEINDLNGRPTMRAISMPDSKHFPMLEETSKFNRLLRDFLELKGESLDELEIKEAWRRRTR